MSSSTVGRRRSRLPSSCALIVCATSLVVSLAQPRGAGAAPPVPTAEAGLALDWIASELGANGGAMPGFSAGSYDWGLTADAVLAFVAAGRADDTAAGTATDLIAANSPGYTTWAPSMPEVRVAGATGKVVLTLRSMGRSATAEGVDLEAELRSLMATTGDQVGRFQDRVPDPTWDASNAFAQSLSMLGLALTPSGIPAESVSFLLAQQCPASGFRLSYSGPAGCDDDSSADTDATAISLQALMAAPRTTQVESSLESGLAWLLVRQGGDGSFGGTGTTAGANTNSSGLIAQTLRAAGQQDAADRAASWIASGSQLSVAVAAGTPAAADVGAIAYKPSSRDTALAGGITAQTRDQWRRATSQAVLALGLSPYGPQDLEPLGPVSTTTTASTSTSTSTTTTSTTSTVETTTSTPSVSTTTTYPVVEVLPADVEPAGVVQSGYPTSASPGSSAATSSAATSTLASTGSSSAVSVLVGLSAIVGGVCLIACSRGRRTA